MITLSARLFSNWSKPLRAKFFFFFLIQYGYKKMQNFTLISNPLKKIFKNAQKKLLAKTWRKYALFFTCTHVLQTCFSYNFFLVHFLKLIFQQDSKSAWIQRFFISFLIKKKIKFIGHIGAFWKLWIQTRKKWLKNQ